MTVGTFVPVQTRTENDTREFIRGGHPKALDNGIFLQDGGRSIDLEPFTLLTKLVATGKWTSFIDETATDGTANPQGIYLGQVIAAADIVAADIVDLAVLRGDALFDNDQLIIEASKLLTTIIASGTVNARTVEDQLALLGLFPINTIQPSGPEN